MKGGSVHTDSKIVRFPLSPVMSVRVRSCRSSQLLLLDSCSAAGNACSALLFAEPVQRRALGGRETVDSLEADLVEQAIDFLTVDLV
jgi:hypothetical protein